MVGETQVRVVHNLIGFPGVKEDEIKRIYSHPQALSQCKEFLETHFPNAEIIPFFDTAGAVSYIKESGDRTSVAIAGAPAALYNGMTIIHQSIETNPSNYTRFYVLTREENAPLFMAERKREKASMLFSVSDEPGSLMKVLEVFYRNGLNMQKLESRPIQGKPWEYTFYVDVLIPDYSRFEGICDEIKASAASFRVLGVYENGNVKLM